MHTIEFISWRVRLWLADYARRVRDREVSLQLSHEWQPNGRFAKFVDRISPFDVDNGYRRRWLRRLLYLIRNPIVYQRFWSLGLVQAVVYRFVPKPGLGRYESMYPSEAMKAEWLDGHTEWAEDTTGDSDWSLWTAHFSMVMPWSREPENWLLHVDSHGYVYAEQYPDWSSARAAFHERESEWSDAINDGETELDLGDLNLEGMPEFNGAFG